jgi:hypothetical protein
MHILTKNREQVSIFFSVGRIASGGGEVKLSQF